MDTTMVSKGASLSIEEASRYLGVGRASLYRLMDSGAVKSFHIGRRRLLLREELDRFIRDQLEQEQAN